jgi:hypothetical protein
MGPGNEYRLVREGIWSLVVDPEIWTQGLWEVMLVHLNASSKNPTRHPLLYLFMWLFSLEAVIRAEKDPCQRRIHWQILKYFFSGPLLFSNNIVVKARKITDDENRPGQ